MNSHRLLISLILALVCTLRAVAAFGEVDLTVGHWSVVSGDPGDGLGWGGSGQDSSGGGGGMIGDPVDGNGEAEIYPGTNATLGSEKTIPTGPGRIGMLFCILSLGLFVQ